MDSRRFDEAMLEGGVLRGWTSLKKLGRFLRRGFIYFHWKRGALGVLVSVAVHTTAARAWEMLGDKKGEVFYLAGRLRRGGK